ncbi:hypothetical protein NXX99_03630 [Bacteroides thetaiotaomicron]|nr:hypothetical protein [Bacteroides thetaiotaomicron]
MNKDPHLVYCYETIEVTGDENEGNGNMLILDLKNQYVGTARYEGDMGGTKRTCTCLGGKSHCSCGI